MIVNRARPIPDVIKDERTPPRIKELLGEIPQIKAFGEEYGLKPTSNYTEYVKIDRPYIVYVVSASEKLAFKPRTWSFPIVGSFTYLGWFDEDGARGLAKELAEEGWDVDLRGASAFSTIGYFRDPVLSSMIPPGQEALGGLVNVVLHESVHATLYVSGQSYFNESLASFVADEITPVYLGLKHGKDAPVTAEYLAKERDWEGRKQRFAQAYAELDTLYRSAQTEGEKTAKKAEILANLKQATGWSRDINNATLIQFRTYGVGMAEFGQLFKACGKDWPRFWKKIATVQESTFPEKQMEQIGTVVLQLAQSGC